MFTCIVTSPLIDNASVLNSIILFFSQNNDIALLRFKLPAPVGTARVLPVCLPKRPTKKKSDEALLVGVEATLAGWGRSWIQSPVPVLQKTQMMIWNNEDCRVKYGYLARNGISDNMICAYPSSTDHNQGLPAPRGRSAEIQDCIVSAYLPT